MRFLQSLFMITIENIRNVRRFNLLVSLCFMLLMGLLLLRQYLNVRDYLLLTGFSVITLLLTSVLFLMKPAYFFFRIEGNKLIIRYYRLLFNVFRSGENTRSMEITRREFRDFEINHYNYGITRELVLTVASKGMVVPYPPISISLLDKEEKKQLVEALEHFRQEPS